MKLKKVKAYKVIMPYGDFFVTTSLVKADEYVSQGAIASQTFIHVEDK